MMATPRTPVKATPTKDRLALPVTSSAGDNDAKRTTSRSVTPSGRLTPAARPRFKSESSASPQVKAALAAMRKKRPPPPAAIAPEDMDPFAPTSSPEPSTSAAEDVVLDWGVKSLASSLEKAKRTGRLNVASRELKRIPHEAYSTLMPISSTFHPSNKPSTSDWRGGQEQVTSMDDVLNAEVYQQSDLKTLIASNNEIEAVEDEIAGFEDLEVLDLHGNCLTNLPLTISLLSNLTVLNLASNGLSSFPLQLLSLQLLRELNLSSNKMTSLWPVEWKTALSHTLNPTGVEGGGPSRAVSPSATPESVDRTGADFWESFPSSPTKKNSTAPADSLADEDDDLSFPDATLRPTATPFPHLTKLLLADNPLSCEAFTETGFAFPPRLADLNLADCTLLSLPLATLTPLRHLVTLDLSGNDFSSSDFLYAPTTPSSSATLPILPRLTRLDLSRTPLESLGPLEQILRDQVRRPVEWTGVSKVIQNLIRNSALRHSNPLEGERLEVLVIECPLRDEQKRRRDAFNVVAPSTPSTPSTDAPGNKELEDSSSSTAPAPIIKTMDEILSNGVTSLDLGSSRQPATPPLPPPSTPSPSLTISSDEMVTEPHANESTLSSDPAIDMLLAALQPSSAKRTITLVKRELTSLSTPSHMSIPTSLSKITHVDLGQNNLSSIPFAELATWGWSSSLLSLSMVRNRAVHLSSPLPSTPFAALRDVDLSANRLVSHSPSAATPFFSLLASLAPNLVTLNVSQNLLSTTAGIEDLLLPSKESGRVGVTELRLAGNKIADLEGLCQVARRVDGGERGTWRCVVLDVENNEIARLPPTLGLLPPSTGLLVRGNTFRIPRREVFENGGSRGLLEWLKDRC